MHIRENISLKPFNTFGIDVVAKRFVEVNSVEELIILINRDELRKGNFIILGGGSNVLFTADYDGLVIKNNIEGIKTEGRGEVLVTAGAGVVWDELVTYCIDNGLGGIENLISIPGSVGAAPIQNIGAYGVELKDTFYSLEAIDVGNGRKCTFAKDECDFGYRYSVFKGHLKGKYIITSVNLLLKKDHIPDVSYGAIRDELQRMGMAENAGISEVGRAIAAIRDSKLPDPEETGNAGSFFKNPVITQRKFAEICNAHPGIPSYKSNPGMIKVPAGWLIEQCGWKGKALGNAAVHDKQALVLVNKGNATGREILTLAEQIKASVLDKFGVNLEMEVNVI